MPKEVMLKKLIQPHIMPKEVMMKNQAQYKSYGSWHKEYEDSYSFPSDVEA